MPENPPAFPSDDLRDEMGCGIREGSPGMTLRDWFAGQAPPPEEGQIQILQGLDRNRNPHNDPHKPRIRSRYEIVAHLNYEYAEAMLSERARRKGGRRMTNQRDAAEAALTEALNDAERFDSTGCMVKCADLRAVLASLPAATEQEPSYCLSCSDTGSSASLNPCFRTDCAGSPNYHAPSDQEKLDASPFVRAIAEDRKRFNEGSPTWNAYGFCIAICEEVARARQTGEQ